MKIIEIVKGMRVVTPLGRPAVVLRIQKGGDEDMFERVVCQYTDVDIGKTPSNHRVALQPHLLRAQ